MRSIHETVPDLWDHEATASETDAQGDAEYQGEKQYKLYSCCLRVDIKGSYPKGCNDWRVMS